jgi:tetratricopeptide (TPR) repeat protein
MRTKNDQRGPGIWRAFALLAFLAIGLGSTACDFLDPTNVENPRTTSDDLAQAEEPTAALLPGLEQQFATALENVVIISECVSDNYAIHGTGLDSDWDFPRDITATVTNRSDEGSYSPIQDLNGLAKFVIEDIIPGDETATAADIAWAHYYQGMAYIFLAENYTAAPVEEDGLPLSGEEILLLAIAEMNLATSGGGTAALAANAALARAYRWLGDASSATSAANQVLNGDPEFYLGQGYDANSNVNSAASYLVYRALQEMQPLPRLDFLDPKYLDREAEIPYAKAEEMHLILAEIDLAGGSYADAKAHLGDAIRLAQSRGTEEWVDDDPRNNADLTIRPRDSEMQIRADADSPYRAGLVQDRNGATTTQYVISGTSLDADSVEALPDGDPDAIWHAFWLARQEILFLEGRRMADLGIRLPMRKREYEQNPNIEAGDTGTEVVVPSYIPTSRNMDLYDPATPYDEDGVATTTFVTIMHDMNKILVQNNASPFR